MNYSAICLVLVCFVVTVSAAGTSSNREHSATYLQMLSGEFTKTMHLPQTFLGDLHDYRCLRLSDDRGELRSEYIKILEKLGIPCTGDWCVGGSYRCHPGNSRECYNVEHIVDLKNSVLDGYNKNIVGNLVMAYGKWNQEMGTMRWTKVEVEKRYVYGNDVVNQAINNIVECHDAAGGDPDDLPNWADADGTESGTRIEIKISFGFLFSIGTLITICVIMFILYHSRREVEAAEEEVIPDGVPFVESEVEKDFSSPESEGDSENSAGEDV